MRVGATKNEDGNGDRPCGRPGKRTGPLVRANSMWNPTRRGNTED
jgi:hypothetical protein